MSNPALPPIAGREAEILALVQQEDRGNLTSTRLSLAGIQSTFACALHMHQPTIPAGTDGALISHLQYMVDNPNEGDNHNAEPFAQCYQRLAQMLPKIIREGGNPRIMLDYSGTLLWGFEQMGRHDILAALHQLACDPSLQPHVEWLGTFWGHAVAPSTPIPDLKLQILAWQQHFLSLFGPEALQRVKGFSLPEMHLPNHPDTLYELVKSLQESGYHWLLVQEHSVENLDGSTLSDQQKYGPNQLIACNSRGEKATIMALVKTQGSDTKLVGQMQPYYEALGRSSLTLQGITIPSVVCQIADGENGGVMMNEFPPAFVQAHQRITAAGGEQAGTVAINGTEFFELLMAAGLKPADFPSIQAVSQNRLWEEVGAPVTPESVEAAINNLRARDGSFSMAGASWTNNLSWVEGYANVLAPMENLSAQFHQLFDPLVEADPSLTQTEQYRQVLLHLLLLETSCFRYWGQGSWTDYAMEIHRRGMEHLAAAQDYFAAKDGGGRSLS